MEQPVYGRDGRVEFSASVWWLYTPPGVAELAQHRWTGFGSRVIDACSMIGSKSGGALKRDRCHADDDSAGIACRCAGALYRATRHLTRERAALREELERVDRMSNRKFASLSSCSGALLTAFSALRWSRLPTASEWKTLFNDQVRPSSFAVTCDLNSGSGGADPVQM
jgi:hypothetical protein